MFWEFLIHTFVHKIRKKFLSIVNTHLCANNQNKLITNRVRGLKKSKQAQCILDLPNDKYRMEIEKEVK